MELTPARRRLLAALLQLGGAHENRPKPDCMRCDGRSAGAAAAIRSGETVPDKTQARAAATPFAAKTSSSWSSNLEAGPDSS